MSNPPGPTRDAAIARAQAEFDSGAFRDRLAALIAIPSTSQDPAAAPDCRRYLEEGITPWLARLGFESSIHPNPDPSCGPILIASRIEDPSRPTVLLYGHDLSIRVQYTQRPKGSPTCSIQSPFNGAVA